MQLALQEFLEIGTGRYSLYPTFFQNPDPKNLNCSFNADATYSWKHQHFSLPYAYSSIGNLPLVSVSLLLQYLLQSCSRGGGGARWGVRYEDAPLHATLQCLVLIRNFL